MIREGVRSGNTSGVSFDKELLRAPAPLLNSLSSDSKPWSPFFGHKRKRSKRVISPFPSVYDTSLDTWETKQYDKIERLANLQKSNDNNRSYSWKYDSPVMRKALANGLKINPERLYKDTLEWVQIESIVTIKDVYSDEKLRCQVPRRGNSAYARKYRKKLFDMESQLKGLEFAVQSSKSRSNYCDSLLLFFTLTYDRKQTSIQDAWANLTKDVNNFKKKVRRRLGFGANVLMVKEGTKDGYPAPHLVVLLERPIRCLKWHGKRGDIRYIVQSKRLVDNLRDCWPNGYIDVRAVGPDNNVDGIPWYRYIFKYLIKSIIVDGKIDSLALKQIAWHKLYRMRPLFVSSSFKDHLNPVRLDTTLNKSCHYPLVLPRRFVFHTVDYCKTDELLSVLVTGAGPPVGSGPQIIENLC